VTGTGRRSPRGDVDPEEAAGVVEVRVDTDHDAQRLAFLGSPTIRINGTDVDPAAATRHDYGLQCRLYRTTSGFHGTPPDNWILHAAHRTQPAF
jgi:hypothetical protein